MRSGTGWFARNRVAANLLMTAFVRSIIREVVARNQVGDVAVSGSAGLAPLKTLGERVRSELTALPEITQAEIGDLEQAAGRIFGRTQPDA